MKPRALFKTFFPFLLFSIFSFSLLNSTQACSRITYTAPDSTVATGRTMDWVEDLKTNLWAFPAGIKRTGSDKPNSVTWTSKYGSVIASGYNIGTTDGINSEGLNANLLYLSTSNYGEPREDRKNISILAWAQYALDNYATVEEAVKDFGQDKFNMVAALLPNGRYPAVHLSLTDNTGDNAIFEYINGKLTIHHNKNYNVMTNEPSYDKQLTLNDYWQNLNGAFLPGTIEPSDRFVRASYFLKNSDKTSDPQKSIAVVFSIIRNVSVPMMLTSSAQPNVASTLWRSAADLKNKIYFFESTDRPNIFWVNLNKLNLAPGASIKKLPLQNGEIYAGEVSGQFVDSKSFFAQDQQIP